MSTELSQHFFFNLPEVFHSMVVLLLWFTAARFSFSLRGDIRHRRRRRRRRQQRRQREKSIKYMQPPPVSLRR